MYRLLSILLYLVACFFFVPSSSIAAVLQGNPSNYTTLLRQLKPGDTLKLAGGTYTKDLNVQNIRGNAKAWITITGPTSGKPATFLARSCCNTVELKNVSYIAIRHLTLDGKAGKSAFGVSAKGGSANKVHHIRVENNKIINYNSGQQTVGISTKTPTWGWEIRGNTILRAGTGMYLGNSNGKEPFFDAIIEHNVIMHTTGYNMQIKHQWKRDNIPGMPTQPTKVILRHNVFIKDNRPSPSGARPNVLIGGFPPSGLGAKDMTEIYGNLFYYNSNESLLQATGRVTIHDNVFVGSKTGYAIRLQKHNINLGFALVFQNTMYSMRRGIYVGSKATEKLSIIGNLIFAQQRMGGQITGAKDNLDLPLAQAPSYVLKPSTQLGAMDFYPKQGKCEGSPLQIPNMPASGRVDFNGTPKGSALRFRGAYSGHSKNPGWKLSAAMKQLTKTPPKEPAPQEPSPQEPTPQEQITPPEPPSKEVTPDAGVPTQDAPLQDSVQIEAPGQEPAGQEPQTTPDNSKEPDSASFPDNTSNDTGGISDKEPPGDAKATTGCGCNSAHRGEFSFGLIFFLLGLSLMIWRSFWGNHDLGKSGSI